MRELCSVDTCEKASVTRHLCIAHYHRLQRYGDPTFDPRPDYSGVDRSLVGVWNTMRSRCHNKNSKSYESYGARGIKVCAAWRASYLNFILDVGSRPAPDMSIDRIDNTAGYSCGHCDDCRTHGWKANVRWATRRQQSENSRAVHLITIDGVTRSLASWSRVMGHSKGTISDRLLAGWSERDAVLKPRKKQVNQAKGVI